MATAEPARERVIAEYRKKINEHRQIEAKLKEGLYRFYQIFSY